MEKRPKHEQVVIVFCPEYCPEQYQIVTYFDGKFIRQPNGDMTEYVVDWKPLDDIEDLF